MSDKSLVDDRPPDLGLHEVIASHANADVQATGETDCGQSKRTVNKWIVGHGDGNVLAAGDTDSGQSEWTVGRYPPRQIRPEIRPGNLSYEITRTALSSTSQLEIPSHENTPSASLSIPQTQPPCHAFINFDGPVVKFELVRPIYSSLERVGVKAFFDRVEYFLGDQIPEETEYAILTARIHIAILSRGYVISQRCLEELSQMLESGDPIIPIFYDVKPASLSLLSGHINNCFRTFRTYETIEKWNQALKKVSFISGYEMESYGDLGVLVKEVVNRVQQEIRNVKVRFEVAKYPVGTDDAVKDFEDATDRAAGLDHTVKIIGIVGMAGCGKTTLARALYNRRFKSYYRCSFLSEIREAALPELQKKLLEDLLNLGNIPFKNADDGKTILAGRLGSLYSRRVLIVLDDVDQVDQLDTLLPDKGRSLGSDSLVIVTTRDSCVLRSWDIFSVYPMPKLDPSHGRVLFCCHAFKGVSPPANLKDLIDEFVRACDGLPLCLKVIAERLYKEPEESWKSELEKISNLLPGDIMKWLKLSYDALAEEEKNTFLDVACFFVGEKKNLAIAVWDAAEWSALDRLVEKCLVEIDHQNRIRMQNHLRDLGREIALDSWPYRLWKDKQIDRYNRKTLPIRGIMAARTKFVSCPGQDEFPTCCEFYPPPFEKREKRMDLGSLEILVVAGNHFTRDFSKPSVNLVWLRWFDFQHKCLLPWISMKKLRVLELYDASSLQELWTDNADPPLELRELIISGTWSASFQRFPSSISHLKLLTKVALLGYGDKEFGITGLPNEFCDLQSLEHLELRNCKLLLTLPTRFGELENLRHLDLRSCQMLSKLPDSFKQLANLEYLNLSGCQKLQPMPDMLENMRKLNHLYFSALPKLRELPLHIAEQKSLRVLHLKRTMLKNVPNNIDQLSNLETLVIGSPQLTLFPSSLGNLSCLIRLKLTGCLNLEALPESLKSLRHLEYLYIKSSGLRSVPKVLRQLSNLQILKIFYCPIAELDFGPPGSSSLDSLKVIHLKATGVKRLSISHACCPNLETLKLELNFSLTEIDILPTSQGEHLELQQQVDWEDCREDCREDWEDKQQQVD